MEFFTKNGKTIVCRKQVDEMEVQIKQAKDLLFPIQGIQEGSGEYEACNPVNEP
jgi:hypothetical protein